MIVRFDTKAVKQQKQESTLGVDNDAATLHENVSETDATLSRTKAQLNEEGDDRGDVTTNAIAEEEDAAETPKVENKEAQAKG